MYLTFTPLFVTDSGDEYIKKTPDKIRLVDPKILKILRPWVA